MSIPPHWKIQALVSNCLKTPLTDPTKRPDTPFIYGDVI